MKDDFKPKPPSQQCPKCGGPLKVKTIKGVKDRYCEHCGPYRRR